ncbi:MAG TPA: serpin family protein [Paludibacteraceae bacterium]|nr:serpin family protein [Paludibacteraceae bacterium]
MKTCLIAMLGLIVLAGCTNDTPSDQKEAAKIELSTTQRQRVVQDNDFAFGLLRKTIEISEEKNVFMSPLSVSLALGMAMNGANGLTRSEIEQVLNFNGMTADEINEYYRLMQQTLPRMDPATKLSIANSIWYRNGFNIKSSFLKINSDYFNATSQGLDFSKPSALETINGWCIDHTNKLIPKVLDEIDANTVLFLINAVYFKGIWVTKFKESDTREADFIDEDGKTVKVDMMQVKSDFGYYTDGEAQYLSMPYGNKAFSMIVILPDDGKTTRDILWKLTAEKLSGTVKSMTTQELQLYFPKFKVKNRFQLKPMLLAMGMKQAFVPDADFSGITDNKPLWIDFVQHDTYVDVNEEGTEAAAVTTIGFKDSAGAALLVNKPFLFVIRENSTGIILFTGKIANPGKSTI